MTQKEIIDKLLAATGRYDDFQAFILFKELKVSGLALSLAKWKIGYLGIGTAYELNGMYESLCGLCFESSGQYARNCDNCKVVTHTGKRCYKGSLMYAKNGKRRTHLGVYRQLLKLREKA
jgi:hypothetical protein